MSPHGSHHGCDIGVITGDSLASSQRVGCCLVQGRADRRDIRRKLYRAKKIEILSQSGLKGFESELELGAVGWMKIALQLLEGLHGSQH